MSTQAPSVPRILIMVVFALSCFGLLAVPVALVRRSDPAQAEGLPGPGRVPRGHPARSRGRRALARRAHRKGRGQAARPRLEPDAGDARDRAPLRADPRGRPRDPAPKTLLGETFVEMTQGSDRAPFVEENGRLEDRHVQESVELDEILDSLDPFTRAAFRTWQQDLGAVGRGARARPQRLVRQPPGVRGDGRRPVRDARRAARRAAGARQEHGRGVRRADPSARTSWSR